MRFPPVILAALLFCWCLGCGRSRIAVTGKVTHQNRPLPDAAVLFVPIAGGRPCSGKTDAQGRYSLSSLAPDDGVPPGEYRVSITAVSVSFDAVPDGDTIDYQERVTWLIPERYGSVEQSELKAIVDAEHTIHDFALE